MRPSIGCHRIPTYSHPDLHEKPRRPVTLNVGPHKAVENELTSTTHMHCTWSLVTAFCPLVEIDSSEANTQGTC